MATDPLKVAIKGSTQDHLLIEDVVDGVVLLKDGSACMIMQVSSVNFDLLSDREQAALVYAYGGILNSLSFDIQIVIHSNPKDVSAYLARLKGIEEKQNNKLLRERMASYRKFIEETVKKNDVLSKAFYVVVPFSTLELGIKSAGSQAITTILPMLKAKGGGGLPLAKEFILEKARASLEPKKDHVVRLFSRLGLDVKVMDSKELISLFYRIYNEETAGNQKVQSLSYSSATVTTKK